MITSRVLRLTGILLKNSRFLMMSKNHTLNIFLNLLFVLAFLPIVVAISKMTAFLYDQFAVLDQEGVILAYALAAMMLVTFFFGIIYVLSIFYFGKDIEVLLPLPLKPTDILGAKLVTVIIYEYLLNALLLIPLLVTYGVKGGEGILFYLYSIIVFLLIPIIPIVMASVVVMLVMRFTNIGKNKEVMAFLGGLLGISISVGLNIFINTYLIDQLEGTELVSLLLEGNNSLVETVSRFFPGSSFAVNAIVHSSNFSGFIQLSVYVVLSALFLMVFMILGKLLYFKGVIGMSESNAKSEEMSLRDWKKTRKTHVMGSLMKREWKILLRTPTFFLNNVLISLIMPILLVVIVFRTQSNDQDIVALRNFLTNSASPSQIIAIFVGLTVFVCGTNGVSATAISREGKNAYIMRMIPVPISTQAFAKMNVGILIGLFSLIFLGGIAFYFGLPVESVVYSLILSINAIIFANLFGIAVDLARPKLEWENEVHAVKQNINVLLGSFIPMGIMAFIGFVIFKVEASLFVTILIYGIILMALNFLLYRLVKGAAVSKFLERLV